MTKIIEWDEYPGSGPYRGQTDSEIDDHIQHARGGSSDGP